MITLAKEEKRLVADGLRLLAHSPTLSSEEAVEAARLFYQIEDAPEVALLGTATPQIGGIDK